MLVIQGQIPVGTVAKSMDPEDLANAARDLRVKALIKDDVTMPPMAEQYHLLALNALEQAERFANLAHYHLMQGR